MLLPGDSSVANFIGRHGLAALPRHVFIGMVLY
jgi:hypothetical protein